MQHGIQFCHDLISSKTLTSTICDAEFAASSAEAKSIAFSSVSGAAASQLLEELHLTEVDGFQEAPFATPPGERPYSEERGTHIWLATAFAVYSAEHIVTSQVLTLI